MKILIHDFAGHPFQVDLSRELASRGHVVTHGWFSGDIGPKGRMERTENDAKTLHFQPFGAKIKYSKDNLLQRFRGDRRYGQEVGLWIEAHEPDIVIFGNTPVDCQVAIVAACEKLNIPFVYWCQDFYSIAVSKILNSKMKRLGDIVGAYYRWLEKRFMCKAAHIIHISESFCDQTDAWGISREKVTVVPNWGAIDEINVLSRETDWARENGMSVGTRLLYSGTLARKHNPEFLAKLATNIDDDASVILVASGAGTDVLRERKKSGELDQLRILPLQPFERFSEVLASGDILLAVIERDAGQFSVPSKILSYLCAGRPIVLAAPKSNLAAQNIESIGAGKVVEPEDIEGFVSEALFYCRNPAAALEAGQRGRRYAEDNFSISTVADRFEAVFLQTKASLGHYDEILLYDQHC